jgi:hypothetical protein
LFDDGLFDDGLFDDAGYLYLMTLLVLLCCLSLFVPVGLLVTVIVIVAVVFVAVVGFVCPGVPRAALWYMQVAARNRSAFSPCSYSECQET